MIEKELINFLLTADKGPVQWCVSLVAAGVYAGTPLNEDPNNV